MGLALAQSLGQQDKSHELGSLRDAFSQGGVSEVTSAEILSIETFLRAEHSLGHIPPESVQELDNMHVEHTDDVVHYLFEKKLRGYNEGDIMAEQSGDLLKSDDDVVTAGGYMKTTVSTVGNQQNKEEKHRRRMQQHLMAIEQNNRLEQILAEIEELKAELAKVEEQISEVEDIQQLLADGDINDSTDIAAAKRKKIESYLKKQGKSLEDYKKADGTIDEERLRRDMDDHKSDLDIKRTDIEKDIIGKRTLLEKEGYKEEQEVQRALKNGDQEAIREMASTDFTNTAATIANAEQNGSLDEQPEFMMAGLLDDPTQQNASIHEPDSEQNRFSGFGDFNGFSDSGATLAAAETPANTERSFGSFAADTDAQDTSVITSLFAQASDPSTTTQRQSLNSEQQLDLQSQQVISAPGMA